MQGWVEIGFFFVVTAMAATTGGLFKPGPWYAGLNKPSWNPPDWLFAPVWSILYLMIAYAGWLVWREAGLTYVIVIWGVQLVFNALWSYLAFGAKRLDLAFYELLFLWLSVSAFTIAAWPIDQTASMLFMPYLLWVSFAGFLNLTVWRMNPVGFRA